VKVKATGSWRLHNRRRMVTRVLNVGVWAEFLAAAPPAPASLPG
jgi:hypothetical protein